MPSSIHASEDQELDLRARSIARSIAESLETSLEHAIKQHLLSSTLDWEVLDPELHLDASLIGRRNETSFTHKLQISPLKLRNVIALPSTPVERHESNAAYPSPVSSTPRELRPRRSFDGFAADLEDYDGASDDSRRPIGGLRLRGRGDCGGDTRRQLQSDGRTFPKRRKINEERSAMKPSTLDKLIISIWEQLHGSLQLDPQVVTEQWNVQRTLTNDPNALLSPSSHRFNRVNMLCRKVTQASRCCRSLEVIVQAHWISCYDERVRQLADENSHSSITKHKMTVLKEACDDFGWTEKDLRNKMAVWRGYHEIERAGGWVSLVFAGMGLYRYCKYRIDFSVEAMAKLTSMNPAFEVAADTLHPQWRQLLSIVDEPTMVRYAGHPHDWVVSERGAIPLKETYLQWDPDFTYEHLADSVVNEEAWGDYDPRSAPTQNAALIRKEFKCEKCGEVQSNLAKKNQCVCFPNLYGSKRGPVPVQVFRTAVGKNNGLMALCKFSRGTSIGEFIGVITSSINNLDCMQSSVDGGPVYQIFQRRKGNFTRFINHSCNPNSQYERFTWLGLQRIVLVSRGIEAGQEITVDYGEGYWQNLDKICRCGESCCRYRNPRLSSTG